MDENLIGRTRQMQMDLVRCIWLDEESIAKALDMNKEHFIQYSRI